MIKEQWIHDEKVIADMYFHKPTQVQFLDDSIECGEDEDILHCAIGGIAYHNYIICGECGSTIALDDITDLFIFSDWADLSDAIKGD